MSDLHGEKNYSSSMLFCSQGLTCFESVHVMHPSHNTRLFLNRVLSRLPALNSYRKASFSIAGHSIHVTHVIVVVVVVVVRLGGGERRGAYDYCC